MPHETAVLPPTPEIVPGSELEQSFASWENRIDRLQAEVDASPHMQGYPEWWYEEDDARFGIVRQFRQPDADLSKVGDYFELRSKELALNDRITGFESLNHPIVQLSYELGEDAVGRALREEPDGGILHASLVDSLESASPMLVTSELGILQSAYGKESPTDLLGIGGEPYSEQIRGHLITPRVVRSMQFAAKVGYETTEWSETQHASHQWLTKALQTISGLSRAEAASYAFSASRRANEEQSSDLLQKFDQLGVDRIRKLTAATGIRGLEGYSIDQLGRMEALIDDPETESQRLAEHDVQVVMVNRAGDHSGVMVTTAETFDDEQQRTLFFEINSLRDVYRHMSQLKRWNVQPSTLVLSAHSSPGEFVVSDQRDRENKRYDIATVASRAAVSAANGNKTDFPGETAFSLNGMQGFARLVENYMRPSRAIDDAVGDKDRKKIIFQACNAGTETDVHDQDASGTKFAAGMESVIGSMGEDLARSGVASNVDIYGAVTTIQMKRTAEGVRYTGQPLNLGLERTPVDAQRIRVENGRVSRDAVAEIPLRQAA